jgi:undecaprenyl phosphate N,N'-diacetylbacillosamine 1-phosphate transferase
VKWVPKRALDVILSLLALVLLAPLFILIAILVRLTSPGPALFRQQRLGRHGVPFTCLKFRTMYVNAPDIRNADGSTFNADNDPRVTAVGNFLRKTTLDELPQFINVLRGEMSVVGPRADPLDVLQAYSEQEKKRLEVKPGMTGWAFIHGRNTVPLPRRRELDVEYVENYSIGLDVQILLRTIPFVLLRKGVYTGPSPTEAVDRVPD